MKTSTTDILIAGAGPTGLTLACVLARHGVRCRIVDRADDVVMASRGKGLQPRSLEVLEDLGVIDTILARCAHSTRLLAHRDGRTVIDLELSALWEGHTPGVPYPALILI